MPTLGRTFDVYVRGEPAAVEAALGELGGRQADGSYALACGTARVGPKAALVAIDLAANGVSTKELLEKLAAIAGARQLSLEANGANVPSGAALVEAWELERVAAERNLGPSTAPTRRLSERRSFWLLLLLLFLIAVPLACLNCTPHFEMHT